MWICTDPYEKVATENARFPAVILILVYSAISRGRMYKVSYFAISVCDALVILKYTRTVVMSIG